MKFKVMFSIGVAAILWLANGTAQSQSYFTNMNGANENIPNASPGTGFAQVTIDLVQHTLTIHADFMNLTTAATAAHVHAPTAMAFTGEAGVATQTPSFAGFPMATSGTYDMTFGTLDDATWNASYRNANGGTNAGAEAAFAQALADGKAYFNIHTSTFPGGEIRGFLVPVPEPSTVGLITLGGLALVFGARRARRS